MSTTPHRRGPLTALVALAVAAVVVPAAADTQAPSGPLTFTPTPARTAPYAIPAAPIETDVPVLGADGRPGGGDDATLHVEVWDPDTSAEPSWSKPVILMFSPNGFEHNAALENSRKTAETADADYIYFLRRHEVPRGYTVVEAEMRGTAKSTGCWDYWGPNSAADFHDLVSWASKSGWERGDQSGRPTRAVGAFGASAEGIAIVNGLFGAPRALKTVVSWQAMWSMYDGFAIDGTGWYDPTPPPIVYDTIDARAVTGDADTAQVQHASCDPEATKTQLTDTTNTETKFWLDRDYRTRDFSTIHASVFALDGTRDSNVLPISIRDSLDRIPTFHRVVVPYWAHIEPDSMTTTGNTYGRNDLTRAIDAWFDQMLGGADTGVRSWPKVQVQDPHFVWRGVQSIEDMTAETRDVPLPGSAATFGSGQTAKFSMPIDKDLHLSGEVTLDAPMSFSSSDASVQMSLWEVKSPSERHLVAIGFKSARHLTSNASDSPVTPGQDYDVHIRTLDGDAWVDKGTTLELDLQGVEDLSGLPNDAPMLGPYYPTMVPSAPYTATIVTGGRAVLHLPLANDSCGISLAPDVATQPAAGATPNCPDDVASRVTEGR